MEKKAKITDKSFARYLGVEDEAENESTLQETAAVYLLAGKNVKSSCILNLM